MSQIQDFPGVSVVSVVSKQTRNGRTMYDIVLSNGMTVSAFDASLATKAHQLTGQAVTARVEQTDKGYLNLKDIGAGSLGMGNGAAAFGAAPVQQAVPFGQPAQQGFAGPSAGIPDFAAQKEQRIIRGNGLNAASALFGPLYAGQPDVGDDVLLTRVLRFAGAFEHFIKTGQNIAQAAQSAAQVIVPEASPAGVAEAVNAIAPGAVTVGAPVEGDALPEAPAGDPTEQPAAAAQPGVPW